MPEPLADSALKDLPALSKIPAFPPIVLRVFDLLATENVEVRKLVEIMTAEPAFSAQILRLANSPLFGFHSRIDSLRHALVILGLRRVRSLALTVATANYMQAALKIQELHRCWRHTLACAILTEELARACSQADDVAYTAGLLHDIGRLGLLVAHPIEYAQLMHEASLNSLELLDLERRLFGVDHCEAGRFLAEQWNLPQEVRVVAGRHHDPPGAPAQDVTALVYLACQLADSLGFWVVPPLRPLSLDEIQALLPEEARGRFSPDSEQLTRTVERRIRSYDVIVGTAHHDPAASRHPEPETAPPEPLRVSVREAVESALPGRSLVRDVLVVLITGLIFSGVFILLFYLFSR